MASRWHKYALHIDALFYTENPLFYLNIYVLQLHLPKTSVIQSIIMLLFNHQYIKISLCERFVQIHHKKHNVFVVCFRVSCSNTIYEHLSKERNICCMNVSKNIISMLTDVVSTCARKNNIRWYTDWLIPAILRYFPIFLITQTPKEARYEF